MSAGAKRLEADAEREALRPETEEERRARLMRLYRFLGGAP